MASHRKPNVVLPPPPMTEPIAELGEVVDLQPPEAFETQLNTLIVETDNVKLIQISISARANVPTHEAQGEIIIHCVEGRALLFVLGETRELHAGQLLYLRVNEPFSIHGIEHTSLLVTIITAKWGLDV